MSHPGSHFVLKTWDWVVIHLCAWCWFNLYVFDFPILILNCSEVVVLFVFVFNHIDVQVIWPKNSNVKMQVQYLPQFVYYVHIYIFRMRTCSTIYRLLNKFSFWIYIYVHNIQTEGGIGPAFWHLSFWAIWLEHQYD